MVYGIPLDGSGITMNLMAQLIQKLYNSTKDETESQIETAEFLKTPEQQQLAAENRQFVNAKLLYVDAHSLLPSTAAFVPLAQLVRHFSRYGKYPYNSVCAIAFQVDPPPPVKQHPVRIRHVGHSSMLHRPAHP